MLASVRAYRAGGAIGIIIPKVIVTAQKIVPGTLLGVDINSTGVIIPGVPARARTVKKIAALGVEAWRKQKDEQAKAELEAKMIINRKV